jgi:hypothetical protein
MSPVFDVKPFWERRNVIHICGGLRGSALSFVAQRWEAVFRRERMPVSIDRNFQAVLYRSTVPFRKRRCI